MYSVKIATTNQQLNSILKLRYEVLRKPWSQTIDSASDQLEHKSINAFIQNNKGIVIACGRLQENENKNRSNTFYGSGSKLSRKRPW